MKLLLLLFCLSASAQIYVDVHGGFDGAYMPIGAGVRYDILGGLGIRAGYVSKHKTESLTLALSYILKKDAFYSPGILIGHKLIEDKNEYFEFRNYFRVSEGNHLYLGVDNEKTILVGMSLRFILNNGKRRFF